MLLSSENLFFLTHLWQQSSTFLAPGTGFMEDNVSTDGGGAGDGYGLGMIQAHYIQAHLLLCDWLPNRPGPVMV